MPWICSIAERMVAPILIMSFDLIAIGQSCSTGAHCPVHVVRCASGSAGSERQKRRALHSVEHDGAPSAPSVSSSLAGFGAEQQDRSEGVPSEHAARAARGSGRARKDLRQGTHSRTGHAAAAGHRPWRLAPRVQQRPLCIAAAALFAAALPIQRGTSRHAQRWGQQRSSGVAHQRRRAQLGATHRSSSRPSGHSTRGGSRLGRAVCSAEGQHRQQWAGSAAQPGGQPRQCAAPHC